MKYMKRALALAAKGLGRTGTNPVVGAVVVKDGKIIGSGFHGMQGGPHAEVEALRKISGKNAKGATLYVTLEPCSHLNKLTPPCTGFLIRSGIKAVVVAVRDPNPAVYGRGIKLLKEAGLKVKVGVLGEEARRLNEFYFKSIRTSLPFITLKLALSVDGKIATSTGSSRWITGIAARRHVHKLRDMHGAVLTTSGTVTADDPHLGVRMSKGRDPLRIIIDDKLRLDAAKKIFRNDNFLLVAGMKPEKQKYDVMGGKEPKFCFYNKNRPLRELFGDLYRRGIGSVMVEAGSRFSAALLREKLVDKCVFFVAPKIVGGDGIPAIEGLGIKEIGDCIRIRDVKYAIFGEDVLMEGYL